ncbi:metallophosphoesterase [Aquimarina algiphila]|uniref:metallophosphoesterase n=1 Tax=Aquimarina algiphila TaxID=2047982 RepID=UPI00232A7E33|nr:metallophosphoesterase [Aquimarina algiphila]
MKKIKKWKLFLLYPILGILTLIIIFILYKMNQSTFILTKNGIYKTLQIPLNSKFLNLSINLGGAGDNPTFDNDFIEGPIVTYKKDDTIVVDWYQENSTHQKTYNSTLKNFTITSKNHSFNFSLPEIKKPITEVTTIPEKITFISDIHGDYGYMDTLLKNLKAIDSLGNWSFGKNHLIIAGDMVDRGIEVSTVLWKIVQLSEQAELAGGMVHYLLGNHEQYLLRGNFSRVHPASLFAIQQMMTFKEAFSNKTYLGQWLRTRPVLLKIGSILIAHGGISPETAAKKYTIKQINQATWKYWNHEAVNEDLKEIIFGETGVTQYRGYIRKNDKVKKTSKKEVDQILHTFNASHIVVGHTDVPTIQPLYQGSVYDINAIENSPQALLFDNGIPKIINIDIIKNENTAEVYLRDFSFFKANDWKAIALTIKNIVKLSSISHPY